MITASVAFACSTATSTTLTPIVRRLAHHWGWLDHALTSRKIHGRPVPRVGGIAIVLAFYAPLVALAFVSTDIGDRLYSHPRRVTGLLVGGVIIAALGLIDDLRGLRARTKLAVQLGVAALMYGLGYRIETIINPFGPDIALGYLALPFTMLWIAGLVNAMNLIDGLDGLAGGVALIAAAATFGMAAFHGDPLMLLVTAALGGAVLGFLFYNLNPATIFMGDAGSMFLGFVLATTAIKTNERASAAVAIVVPIIALGVPIADTVLAVARRAMRGAPLFSADRGHIHHRLLDLGLSHRQAVLAMLGASALLGTAALVFSVTTGLQATLFLLALSSVGYLVLRRLGYARLHGTHALLAERRRNLEMRQAVRSAGDMMRHARCELEAWAALLQAVGLLGAEAVAVTLDNGQTTWRSYGFDDCRPGMRCTRHSLLADRNAEQHLVLGWGDGTPLHRDTEIAVELLCDHLVGAIERLEPARLRRLRVVGG